MARPRRYTDEQIVAALAEKRGAVYLAAEVVGCDADTIYHRAKTSKAVAAAIAHQRGKLVDTAETKLADAIDDGQAWAISLCLKTLGKDRGFYEKSEVQQTGSLKMELVEEIIDADGPQDGPPPPGAG